MILLPAFMRGACGVYGAIHRDTGNCYVGSSSDIAKRLTQHLGDAARNSTNRFHLAINKYGPEAFDFEILEQCDKASLLERERFYIALMGAATIEGFNTASNPTKPRTGTGHSEITKQRIGAANRGRKRTDEHRAKISDALLGRKMPVEAIAKTAAAHRGRKHSPEARARMSAAAQGRTFSEEHRAKISAANTGKKHSPEWIEKSRAKRIGQKRSEEFRARMREHHGSRIRKPHSAETRAKIAESHKRRIAEKELLPKT